ncbi:MULTISPECIES: Lrp/AsnC family transcriptional regulator [unclassified Halanaerobium]|uniref:siroheme decarboxylase subunit alpha n=1 Tax=unclassified Halanaerobium TaxID=2641197 RepID=UPI000DF1CB1D|nr:MULTISPECIES: Lrp/AsnC family transcriptional regulator [unclassified Halanaerobium]RCW48158.1 DNA-binding Lrp family transcriptional regulator [Halanaerobium sp. MA284_MarDTE_T2]RCW80420.1 DNA-binding Lrp family transcriptional regulator [Halanaerobium sp. DL-01]
MEKIDNKILDSLQTGLKLEASPFQKIAAELGIEAEELLQRIKKLKKEGYIRRLGGVFRSSRLGYKSTLIALEVEEANFYQAAEIINQHSGVTHNYRRDHQLNLWFTLSTTSELERENFLAQIKALPGVKKLYQLPKEKFFKLNVFFKMEEEAGDDHE